MDQRDLKGKPSLQALLGCPWWPRAGAPGVLSCDSPRGSTDLVLEGLAKQFLFASFPSPMFPLFFLRGAFLPSLLPSRPPPRDCVTARHPRFRLEVCRPVQARTFQSSPAAQPPPACGAGTPPEPSREGRILCRECHLNLRLSVQRAFLSSSPLLPQDQAHVGSKLNPSHGPSRGTVLD